MNTFATLGYLLRPYLPHVGAAVAAIMLGCGVGYMKVSTRPPEVDIADNWTLPRWSPHQPSVSPKELARLELWGPDNRARADAESVDARDVPPWRFIGVIQDGPSRLAVIELTHEGGLQRLNAGEKLPDGAEILAIGAGDLTISENGTESTITLFSTEEG